MFAKPGDAVRAGDPLLELHADDPTRFPRAVAALEGAYDIDAQDAQPARPLVIDRIAGG
jgi:thymidine phosphorylase